MLEKWAALRRHWTLVRYGCAVLAAWVRSASGLFARPASQSVCTFSGGGGWSLRVSSSDWGPPLSAVRSPLLVWTLSSFFLRRYSFSLNTRDAAERLVVFLALALLVGSLARQRTKAD